MLMTYDFFLVRPTISVALFIAHGASGRGHGTGTPILVSTSNLM
jgi:hypothetical protein